MATMRNYLFIKLGLCCHILMSIITPNVVCASSRSSPPLLVVSLDGLRADRCDEFVQQNPTSSFARIINNGLKADYMIPIYPTLTFPNHFTLVTGVYSETHGIVGNQMYDPSANVVVNFLSDSNSDDPAWWNRSEPIWLTAKKQGLKTAALLWPGCNVVTRSPDIYLPYTSKYTFSLRIDELVSLFEKFELDLGLLYFSEPDSQGHSFGPDNQKYKDKIKEMDNYVDYLLDQLEKKSLLKNMNIIVTSDHGMAASNLPPILVTKYVDTNLIDFNRSLFSYVSHVYPKDASQLSQLYTALQALPNTTVYYKKDVPDYFHYSNSDRIGPIVAIPQEGFSHTIDPLYQGIPGIHGFDNRLVSMRTIFMAFGPSFKKNQTIRPFESVNVQPLMCKLLNIDASATPTTNGSAKIFESYLQTPNGATTARISWITQISQFNLLVLFVVKNFM